jgi:hypothetical protein
MVEVVGGVACVVEVMNVFRKSDSLAAVSSDKHRVNRPQHKVKVTHDRYVPEVPNIHPHPIGKRDAGTIDLPSAGKAGCHVEPLQLPILASRCFFAWQRSWTDN